MPQYRIAFVSSPYLGWKSLRQRWENAFSTDPTVDFLPIHWEEHAVRWQRLYERTGRLQSIYFGMAGRQASLEAIKSGFRNIFLTTNTQAGLLPQRKGVRYFVYGDATARQLQKLYGRGESPRLEQVAYGRIGRYGDSVHHLCLSQWYRNALSAEYGIPSTRSAVLLPAVDTNLWTTDVNRTDRMPTILFIGGDFHRKGGPLLREVAKTMKDEARFVYVTKNSAPCEENEEFHTGLKADSSELLSLMRSAYVLVLPTKADCSAIVCVEAAASGVPSIASPVGGVPEIVIDNSTGIIVENQDPAAYREAILKYIRDPSLRDQHGKNARERALTVHSLTGQINVLKNMLHAVSPS